MLFALVLFVWMLVAGFALCLYSLVACWFALLCLFAWLICGIICGILLVCAFKFGLCV